MKTYAAISPDQTAGDAFAAILAHNQKNLNAWRDKARTWDDVEGVHQVRVTFRRLRSAFSIFRPILDRDTRKRWSRDTRDLVDQTGMARDIDVLITEGLPDFRSARPDIKKRGRSELDAILFDRRSEAYDQVRTMLDSEACRSFDKEFFQWIDTAGWKTDALSKKKRRRLDEPVDFLARHILDKQDRAVREMGDATDPEDSEAMHRLRIECKKLRYASEFFFPLFPDIDAYLKNMKGMQDVLGVMHDAAVLPQLMHEIVPAKHAAAVAPQVQGLIAWRAEQYLEKSAQFEEQWSAFVAAQRPWRIEVKRA